MSSDDRDDEGTLYFPGTTRIAPDEYLPVLARHKPEARLQAPSRNFEDDDEAGWFGVLPNNDRIGPFADEQEAVAAVEETLLAQGWVQDIETAQRRAQDQAQLRKLGKLVPPEPGG